MSWERVYKALSLVAHCVFALGISAFVGGLLVLPLAFGLDLLFHVNDAAVFGIFLCAFVCILVAASFWTRKLAKNDIASSDEEKSRFQSLVLWGILSILLMMLSLYLGWLLENDAFALLFFVWPIAALCIAVTRPFRKHSKALAVQAIALGGLFWVLLFFGFMLARMGKTLEYTGDNVQDIPHLSEYQKKIYFPNNASNVTIHGTTAAFDWECSVSEKDFQEFAKMWEFQKITEARQFDKFKVPYYYYNWRAGDGGGVTMHYLPDEQKLLCSYSHH